MKTVKINNEGRRVVFMVQSGGAALDKLAGSLDQFQCTGQLSPAGVQGRQPGRDLSSDSLF